MPSKSKKQHNFMAAVANNPEFAKKAGVPQSVGKDYTEADTMQKQGYNDRLDESLGERNGEKEQSMKSRRDESRGMTTKLKSGGTVRGSGIATKGTRACKMVTMKGS
jgi:hypothetical protein|tara:strand:- start:13 stop:333 length:321 start_codon:yes stop_codon:yes gene_type:complete